MGPTAARLIWLALKGAGKALDGIDNYNKECREQGYLKNRTSEQVAADIAREKEIQRKRSEQEAADRESAVRAEIERIAHEKVLFKRQNRIIAIFIIVIFALIVTVLANNA